MKHGHKPEGVHSTQIILAYPGIGKYKELIHVFPAPFRCDVTFLDIRPKPLLKIASYHIDNDGWIDRLYDYVWFEDPKELLEVKILANVRGKKAYITERVVWSSHNGMIYQKEIYDMGQRVDGLVDWSTLSNLPKREWPNNSMNGKNIDPWTIPVEHRTAWGFPEELEMPA